MSVVKRNGKQVKFNFSKIKSGVVRAAKDVGGSVSTEDLKSLQAKFDPDAEYTVDRISDIVEEWLMGMGLHRVLKSYILYKEEHKKARFVKDRLAYISKYVNSGENASTSSETDANANVLLKNVANLEGEVYKMQNRQMQREHMFNQLTLMYPESAKQYEQDLEHHIIYAHDESCSPVQKAYCMAASLFPLMTEGVGNIDGVTPEPPNDIKSYSGQVTNLIFSLSSQVKGAVACLYGKQKLHINGKWISISDFVKSRWSDNYEKDGDWEFCRVSEDEVFEDGRNVKITKVYRKKYSDLIYRITSNKGYTALTSKDHKFKVMRGNEAVTIPASELSVLDTVFVNDSIPFDCESESFKEGWITGMILGDGCISIKNRFNLSVNYEQEYYGELFESYSNELYGDCAKRCDGHKCYQYQTGKAKLYEEYSKNIEGTNTFDKKIKDIEKRDINFLIGALDGIMCSDGSDHHSIFLSLVNKELIMQVEYILDMLGVNYHYREIPAHDNKSALYSLNISSYEVMQYLRKFSMKLDGSKKKLDNVFYHSGYAKKRNMKFKDYIHSNKKEGGRWIHFDKKTDVITKIETFLNDDEYVYEIETESHWYNCGGFITHNCSEYLVAMNYYVIAEFGDKWYEHIDDIVSTGVCRKAETVRSRIHDGFKQFIWGINQPAGNRSYQSPFTNVSYFDRTYFESLFADFRYPDGTAPEWKAIDTLQRMFMKFFNKLRLKAVLTFPVETLAMVYNPETGDIIDKDYKELCAEMYAEGHSFFTYISDSADSLSSCCFSGDTEVVFRRSIDKDSSMETSKLFDLYNETCGERIFVYYEGSWNPARCIRLNARKMYSVSLSDGSSYVMTDNHINVTSSGEKQTCELVPGDQLKFCRLDGGENFYKDITEVCETEYNDKFVYCVECLDKSLPYFTLASGLITHNCRLKNEIKENTFSPTSGMTGIMTGSCNVITLNFNRIVQDWYREIRTAITVDYIPSKEQIATEFNDSTSAWVRSLRQYICNILDRVYKYHIAYKTMLYDLEDKKMYASSNAGYIYLKKLYSTVGINGLNEAARFFGLQVSNNEPYINFLQFILGTIKEQNKLYSIHDKKRPFVFNSEVVPAEGLGAKNYNWDKEDGYWVPEDENLYNSYFYNAHDPNTTVLDKFILHGRKTFQYTDGGSALHCNLDSHLSKEQYLKLIDFAIKNGTSYFTFNIPNSKDNACGYIHKGIMKQCPKCGSTDITYYTRVIGYLRPVSSFGKDRQIEAAKRVYSDGAAELQKTEE